MIHALKYLQISLRIRRDIYEYVCIPRCFAMHGAET
jgi:hypothetical protein